MGSTATVSESSAAADLAACDDAIAVTASAVLFAIAAYAVQRARNSSVATRVAARGFAPPAATGAQSRRHDLVIEVLPLQLHVGPRAMSSSPWRLRNCAALRWSCAGGSGRTTAPCSRLG